MPFLTRWMPVNSLRRYIAVSWMDALIHFWHLLTSYKAYRYYSRSNIPVTKRWGNHRSPLAWDTAGLEPSSHQNYEQSPLPSQKHSLKNKLDRQSPYEKKRIHFHTFPNHDTEKIKLCKIPETRNCVLKSFHLLYTNVQNKRSKGVTPQSGQRSYPEKLEWWPEGTWAPFTDSSTQAATKSCGQRIFAPPHAFTTYRHRLASRKHANIFNNKRMMPAINTACLIFHLLTLIIGSQLDWDTSLSFTWLYEFYLRQKQSESARALGGTVLVSELPAVWASPSGLQNSIWLACIGPVLV